MLKYRIRIADIYRHHFEVECTIPDAGSEELFRMPSWIPGSYLLREYARHVVSVRADSDGSPVDVEKIDKSTWRCTGAGGALTFRLVVYALDQSVRGAFLDARRAYFNCPCVFVGSVGRESEPVELVIEQPAEPACAAWKVATAMRPRVVNADGYGSYLAQDYDELLDHPVEISDFESIQFEAEGVPHKLVIAGRVDTQMQRIAEDLQSLCETQIRFFGGTPPFDRYVFMGLAVGNGYGGLEHRASSSLIFNRTDLPRPGESERHQNYQRFLALCSHEYFHTWHVKRTKPAAFVPYRLNERSYTRLLWVFEGITSYYQELMLLRSGLVDVGDFLRRIGETFTRVYRSPGRRVQSIAQASFDAWDVLYKPGPNSPNSSISYYSKGAIVALALDLVLRRRIQTAVSLDTLVAELWKRFGAVGRGVDESEFESLADELAGESLGEFFDTAVRGTDDLPLSSLLAEFGVGLAFRPTSGVADKGGVPVKNDVGKTWLGASWRPVGSGLELTTVLDGGPLQQAGLNPGDVLLAIDKLQLTAGNAQTRLDRYQPGEQAEIAVFRGDELITVQAELASPPEDSCFLFLLESPDSEALALRKAWLGA